MNNTTNSLYSNAASVWKTLRNAFWNYNLYEVGDPDENPQMNSFCNNLLWRMICNGLRNDSNSEPSQWNNPDRCAVRNARSHSNTSVKSVVHFAQLVKSDYYQQYDYGSSTENRNRYGGTTIPKIPYQKIAKVPIAYFVGLQDDLADPVDT